MFAKSGYEPIKDGGELNDGKEGGGEYIVASAEPAMALDPGQEVLGPDEISLGPTSAPSEVLFEGGTRSQSRSSVVNAAPTFLDCATPTQCPESASSKSIDSKATASALRRPEKRHARFDGERNVIGMVELGIPHPG